MHGARPRPLALRLLGLTAPWALDAARGLAWRLRSKRPAPSAHGNGTAAAFTAADLSDHLRSMGISPGDTLLAYVSLDALPPLEGSPTTLVRVLMDLIGPDGTLCMPTEPVRHGADGQAFDVRSTPSSSGLLSEIFRRVPGTRRSMQERSITALGPLAESLTQDHHRDVLASGPMSPWARLAEAKAKILCLGLSAVTNTMFHCGEDLAPELFPVDLYGDTSRTNTWRDENGIIHYVPVRLRRRKWVLSVDAAPLLAGFQDNVITSHPFQGAPCSVTLAAPFLERLLELAQQGVTMYGFRKPESTPNSKAAS